MVGMSGRGEAWETELRRLKGEWREGGRQHLALGAAAYGLALGIAPEKIEKDVKALAESTSDPEVSRRMEAVRHTVSKHASGKRVAWIRWYRQAGLEAPRVTSAPSPEVLSILEQLAEHVLWGKSYWATLWKGKGGLTAWSLYRALARMAWIHGMLHEEGVEVSLSTRALAEEAAIGHKAALKGLENLCGANLAKRSEPGAGTRAGKIVLSTGSLPTPTIPARLEDEGYSTRLTLLQEGGAERMVSLGLSAPHLRWGSGRPGKLAEAVLAMLQRRGEAIKEEIADALVLTSGGESRNLEGTLELLEGRRLLIREEHIYRLAPDIEEVLLRSCELDGSLDSERRQREYHKEERARFQQALRKTHGLETVVAEPLD